MNINTFGLIFILLTLGQTSLFGAENMIDFKKVDLKEAGQSGKRILVSFTADWCLPCKLIDESIFQDEEIAGLINEHFTPVKADIDSPLGNQWNDLYNANYLPTILFTNKSGNELERLKGIPKREGFIKLLKSIIESDVLPIQQTQFEAINVKNDKPITSRPTIIENKEAVNISGYVIQFGAFGSKENADKLISTLKDHQQSDVTILEEHTSTGKLLYKVLQTGFDSQTDALSSLKTHNKQGFSGFVKKLE